MPATSFNLGNYVPYSICVMHVDDHEKILYLLCFYRKDSFPVPCHQWLGTFLPRFEPLRQLFLPDSNTEISRIFQQLCPTFDHKGIVRHFWNSSRRELEKIDNRQKYLLAGKRPVSIQIKQTTYNRLISDL